VDVSETEIILSVFRRIVGMRWAQVTAPSYSTKLRVSLSESAQSRRLAPIGKVDSSSVEPALPRGCSQEFTTRTARKQM